MAIEIVLSVSLLIFALLVLLLLTLIASKADPVWDHHAILRVFGLTLVVSMSVLLIIAGYDKDQIAPVMGLLGVVAGYLLGNSERPNPA